MQTRTLIRGLLLVAGLLAMGCGGVEKDVPEPSDLMSREDAINYCDFNEDCLSYESCVSHRCVRPCNSNGSCPSTYVCCNGNLVDASGMPVTRLCIQSTMSCPPSLGEP
jgi:hypothetical protein